MADTKISALTAATAALAADELAVNEAGASKKVTVQQLFDLGSASGISFDRAQRDALKQSADGAGVVDKNDGGCAVTAQGAPDMTVAVARGIIRNLYGAIIEVDAGNGTITTAHATLPRIDLVCTTDVGAIEVTAGTPAASPIAPALPAGRIPLATVLVPANDTTIETSQITDQRVNASAFRDRGGSGLELHFVKQMGIAGTGTGDTSNNGFAYPVGIASDGTHIYIADSGNLRIKKHLAADLTYVAKVGSVGTGNDQFLGPSGITTDGTHIWITDAGNNRISKRQCSDLVYVSKIGSFGTGNDNFKGPLGIAFSGTHVFVADTANHRIHKRLASDLSYVAQVGSSGTGNDQFSSPSGIASDGTHIYIADSGNHRIVKRLISDLTYVAQVGSLGIRADHVAVQFDTPEGVAVANGYLYVADTLNHRIVKLLASDLSYIAQVGSEGLGVDQFYNPKGVGVDAAVGGYIYVGDSDNDRIQKRLAAEPAGLPTVDSLTSAHTNATTTGTAVSGLTQTLATGHYVFTYHLIVRTAAAATGLALGVNFTGTQTALVALMRYPSTGTTATSGSIDDDTAGATSQMMEHFVTRTVSTTTPDLGPLTSFATPDVDHYIVVEGVIVVTVSGNLELWAASEATDQIDIRTGSSLILTKTG